MQEVGGGGGGLESVPLNHTNTDLQTDASGTSPSPRGVGLQILAPGDLSLC